MRRVIASIILLIASASVLHAGDETKRTLDHGGIGFRGLTPVGRWVPMDIRMSNPGPAVQGRVDLHMKHGGESASRVFSKKVFLPAQCRRSYTYPAKLDTDVEMGQGDRLKPVEYSVTLSIGNVAAQTNKFLCQPLEPLAHYVVGLDRNGGHYSELKGHYLQQFRREIATLGWTPDGAPERTQEYMSADALVIGDGGEQDLSLIKQRAIAGWIETGGLCVFSPGTDPKRYDGTVMGEMLPVRITGARKVNNLDCFKGFGPPLVTKDPVTVLESVQTGGEVLLADGELPLIVRSRVGLGTLYYVAADITHDRFRNWKGFKPLLTRMLETSSDMLPHEDRLMEKKSASILERFAGLKVPSRRAVVIYMAIAAFLVIVPLAVMRKAGRADLGWALSLAACALCTLVAYGIGKGVKGISNVSVNEVFFAKTASGMDRAKFSGFAGVISPGRQSFDVVPLSDRLSFEPLGGPGGKSVATVFETVADDSLGVGNFLVNENSMRGFSYSGLADLGGAVTGRCELSADGLSVTVKNGLPYPLKTGFLRFNRLVVTAPDIESGGEETLRFGKSAGPAGIPSYSTDIVSDREGVVRSELRKCFFPDPNPDVTKQGIGLAMRTVLPRHSGASFFGWTREKSGVFEIEEGEAARSLGLIGVRLPVTRTAARVLVPRGVCRMKLPTKAFGITSGEVLSDLTPWDLRTEFRLPDACGGMKAERIKVFWNFQAKNVNAKIEIGRPAGKKDRDGEELADYADHGQGQMIEVRDPAAVIDGKNDRVFVKVLMQARRPQSIDEMTLLDTSWQLWGLDVEIEGSSDDQN